MCHASKDCCHSLLFNQGYNIKSLISAEGTVHEYTSLEAFEKQWQCICCENHWMWKSYNNVIKSPDLNPIEHLWDVVERELCALDVHPTNLHQLQDDILSIWANISKECLLNQCHVELRQF